MDVLPEKVIQQLLQAGAPMREENGKRIIDVFDRESIAVFDAYLKAESDAELATLAEPHRNQTPETIPAARSDHVDV
jgi:hypothetical protein